MSGLRLHVAAIEPRSPRAIAAGTWLASSAHTVATVGASKGAVQMYRFASRSSNRERAGRAQPIPSVLTDDVHCCGAATRTAQFPAHLSPSDSSVITDELGRPHRANAAA